MFRMSKHPVIGPFCVAVVRSRSWAGSRSSGGFRCWSK
jgi:hypothetical protein